jgi:hypothetical protein
MNIVKLSSNPVIHENWKSHIGHNWDLLPPNESASHVIAAGVTVQAGVEPSRLCAKEVIWNLFDGRDFSNWKVLRANCQLNDCFLLKRLAVVFVQATISLPICIDFKLLDIIIRLPARGLYLSFGLDFLNFRFKNNIQNAGS